MEWIVAMLTLSAMEIVLGIDNIVFISILCGKLPEKQRARARNIGLMLAMGTRLLLLLSLNWVLGLTQPVFQLTEVGVPASWIEAIEHPQSYHPGGKMATKSAPPAETHAENGEPEESEINDVSVRDLILLVGGLFLIGNSVLEIHHKIEGANDHKVPTGRVSMRSVLFQIAVLDIIFSLDSVITAVGMSQHIWVMAVAIVIAVGVMLVFAGAVERFVQKYPTIKMLALSFLILIGVLLVAEGVGTPVSKGYVYFAMVFSLLVELLNMRVRGTRPAPAA